MPVEPTNTAHPASAAVTFRPEMAFPYLTDEMIARIEPHGVKQAYAADVVLWTRGDREVDLFVVLDGEIEVYTRDENGSHNALTTLGSGQFSGELDLLSSRRTLVNGRTISECLLLRVPRADLQRLMRSEGDIANLIMQATIWRRLGIVERAASNMLLLGRSSAAETIQLQRFLTRNAYPHQLLEPTAEQAANAEASANERHLLPAVIFPDGRVLHQPTLPELADELGLTEVLDPETTYDLAVVGAGPSGLAAAVYGASEGLSTIVIEGIAPGGQAGTSSKIENYLGFPTGVSGQELASRAQVQAQKFGARLAIARDVTCVDPLEGTNRLTLAGGSSVCARAVVIATGAQYRKLEVEDYERFEGQGIHYAATALEAALCQNREIIVVGGGNSAGQAAVFLSSFAKHVHLIVRGNTLTDTMSQYLIERIAHSKRITIHTASEIERLAGENVLRCVTWRNNRTGARETKPIQNIFVMIGAEPNSGWLFGTLVLDKKGFIVTETSESFEPSRFATSIPGIFAIGDVRSGSVKRVASAVGEGSAVISDVHRYLAIYREKTKSRSLRFSPVPTVHQPLIAHNSASTTEQPATPA